MTEQQNPQPQPPYKRLVRLPGDNMIGGVSAALARYFNIDPVLMRILVLLGIVFTFPIGLVVYFVMWAIIPKQ